MSDIKIEQDLFTPGPSPLEDVCWLAREILGGYMDGGVGLDMSNPDEPLDDHDEDETGIRVHETPQLPINHNEVVSLTNTPYVDRNGQLEPLLEPGYVALQCEPNGLSEVSTEYLDRRCKQIIFRTPNPGRDEEAAIFVGFSVEEAQQIQADEIRRIKRLDYLLHCMRTGYRLAMSQDPEWFDNTYLSQTPLQPFDEAVFDQFFGQ